MDLTLTNGSGALDGRLNIVGQSQAHSLHRAHSLRRAHSLHRAHSLNRTHKASLLTIKSSGAHHGKAQGLSTGHHARGPGPGHTVPAAGAHSSPSRVQSRGHKDCPGRGPDSLITKQQVTRARRAAAYIFRPPQGLGDYIN